MKVLDLNSGELLYFYRLKLLNRYESHFRLTYETVAEHSYFVVLFTMLLCDDFGVSSQTKLKAMEMAVTHDIPEIELSDIPQPTKRFLEDNFKVTFSNIEEKIMDDIMPAYVFHVNEFAKQDTIISNIVKLADILSVIQYCEHEKVLGSNTMESILKVNKQNLEKLFKSILTYNNF